MSMIATFVSFMAGLWWMMLIAFVVVSVPLVITTVRIYDAYDRDAEPSFPLLVAGNLVAAVALFSAGGLMLSVFCAVLSLFF